MHQIAAAIWNRIAETQELRTAFARRMFPLDQDALNAALEAEESRLAKAGWGDVTAPYLTVMPLLWENEAIAAFVTENPTLAQALPNVVDRSEAVMLMSKDYPLTQSRQKRLSELLQTPPV